MNKIITIEALVKNNIDKVWSAWNTPEDIKQWLHASDDWECPHAENDVTVGGKFLSRMAAKDGSTSFDFTGTYTEVVVPTSLAYTADDGRKVTVSFTETPDGVHISETFEMENTNSEEMQRGGWQAILNNFKAYAEKK
jgi:uncharacterized protein YndB with AHSA1/START domain